VKPKKHINTLLNKLEQTIQAKTTCQTGTQTTATAVIASLSGSLLNVDRLGRRGLLVVALLRTIGRLGLGRILVVSKTTSTNKR
jgi:hypothetical protein